MSAASWPREGEPELALVLDSGVACGALELEPAASHSGPALARLCLDEHKVMLKKLRTLHESALRAGKRPGVCRSGSGHLDETLINESDRWDGCLVVI
jgi:hypothetical protein